MGVAKRGGGRVLEGSHGPLLCTMEVAAWSACGCSRCCKNRHMSKPQQELHRVGNCVRAGAGGEVVRKGNGGRQVWATPFTQEVPECREGRRMAFPRQPLGPVGRACRRALQVFCASRWHKGQGLRSPA